LEELSNGTFSFCLKSFLVHVNFKIRLSISLSFFYFKDSALFFKHFQNSIRGSNMSLQPFLTINVKINKSFQAANNKIIPLNVDDVPSLLLGKSRQ
jgi:hypothetical protein